jgi:hypothetical protein
MIGIIQLHWLDFRAAGLSLALAVLLMTVGAAAAVVVWFGVMSTCTEISR